MTSPKETIFGCRLNPRPTLVADIFTNRRILVRLGAECIEWYGNLSNGCGWLITLRDLIV
jgi:hypothetical protein